MRHEDAVSEVIGAVLLIGVVMLSMGIIGVIMLSTPPPEKAPKASLTSYCVRCDLLGNYEILIYHGGGETMNRKNIKFYLYYDDGSQREIIPWWVYDGNPEDCMFPDTGSSSLSVRDYWSSTDEWKSGQTLRFREIVPSTTVPIGIEIRNYPFTSPMVKVNLTDKIKNSSCVENYNPASCDPERELVPVLITPRKRDDPGCHESCEGGLCQAQFMYQMNYTTEDAFTYVYERNNYPRNYFKNNNTPVYYTSFKNSRSMTDIITVNFSNETQWWLGRTKSEIARCE